VTKEKRKFNAVFRRYLILQKQSKLQERQGERGFSAGSVLARDQGKT